MSVVQSIEVPESPVPDVLYKYFPPERIDVLESMELRFTNPSQFNDTFDTHYLVPTSQGPKVKSAGALLRNRLGIFCLTEKPDNHLMWVHYAKNRTGFVLGFDAQASFFQENDRVLRKVIYESGPRVFPKPDANVCFYKSNAWTYEQEWRCVREFQPSDRRSVQIDPGLITHIIFGSRMEDWQIARIMLYATGYDMIDHTQFLVSSPSRTSWSIENHAKKMSLCTSCGGTGYSMED